MQELSSWIQNHQALLESLGKLSLVVLAITLVALPVVVLLLPENYFTAPRRKPSSRRRKHPFLWSALIVLKNLLGLLLILVGVAMLVLPGQGALTILIGLALTNFPGKYGLERRLVCQPAVGKTLNRIRSLGGKEDLIMPCDEG